MMALIAVLFVDEGASGVVVKGKPVGNPCVKNNHAAAYPHLSAPNRVNLGSCGCDFHRSPKTRATALGTGGRCPTPSSRGPLETILACFGVRWVSASLRLLLAMLYGMVYVTVCLSCCPALFSSIGWAEFRNNPFGVID